MEALNSKKRRLAKVSRDLENKERYLNKLEEKKRSYIQQEYRYFRKCWRYDKRGDKTETI